MTRQHCEKIHSFPGHYILKAGHEVDAVETVVHRIYDLLIVKKSVTETGRAV